MTRILKLSELADNIEIVGKEDPTQTKYTAAKLKREILELGASHDLYDDWYTIQLKKWFPDAKYMLSQYIENEYQSMYEYWDERAMDCITDEIIQRIQEVLDEAFSNSHATDYWIFDKKVEIDVFPY